MQLTDYSSFASIPKRIHFIGIGGIGMSSLAQLCINKGWFVQGSNIGHSKIMNDLKGQGALVFSEHQSGRVGNNVDVVVVSSAIKADNPELQDAYASGLTVMHRSQFLRNLVQNRDVIAVTGTHGKTTTTSLLGHVLINSGCDPLIISGGVMTAHNSTIHDGHGQFAVVEADESDKSHINFQRLYGGIVTNIEAEHMENYFSMDSLLEGFKKFLEICSNFAVVCGDNAHIQALIPQLTDTLDLISYGFTDICQVRAFNLRHEKTSMIFDMDDRGEVWKDVRLQLCGEHNVLNALAVTIVAKKLLLSEESVRLALQSFYGVDRRLTIKGTLFGTTIIDDYAHHPTEIKAVLTALRKMGYKKILALCQPHRYTRLRDTYSAFIDCFDEADRVILFPVYSAGEPTIEGIHSEALAESLRKKGRSAEVCSVWPESYSFITEILAGGGYDVAICLGAGNITDVASHLLLERALVA